MTPSPRPTPLRPHHPRLRARPVWAALLALGPLAWSACGGAGEPTTNAPNGALPAADGPDADGDGLSDAREAELGTDPAQKDSDGDGKSDGVEVLILRTDPRKLDTDGDGLGDGAELKQGTDPLVADAQVTPSTGPDGAPFNGVAVHPDGTPVDPNAPTPGPDGAGPTGGSSDAVPSTDPRLPPLPRSWTPPPFTTADGRLSTEWACSKNMKDRLYVLSSACFLPVPGGSFLMGAQATDPSAPGYDEHAAPNEGPVHQVRVSSFWLQQDEVRAETYRYCIAAGACSIDDVLTEGALATVTNASQSDLPANGVTYEGAQKFCRWIGARLPTEAEWEFAARSTKNLAWPWGASPWCGVSGPAPGMPAPPTAPDWTCRDETLISNERIALRGPFEHRGLIGNVWEWVADGYAADAYRRHAAVDPTGPMELGGAVRNRAQRGGSWMVPLVWDRRPTARSQAPPEQKLPDVGFRCAWQGPVP